MISETNLMVFTSHSVPLPATRDLWSLGGHLWQEMAPRERQKLFHFLHTSDCKQILTTYEYINIH